MKRCYKCGQYKDLSEFNKDRWKKDGLQDVCRDCNKKRAKDRRKRIKEMRQSNDD